MTKFPQNHKVRCACPVCKNIRKKEGINARRYKPFKIVLKPITNTLIEYAEYIFY